MAVPAQEPPAPAKQAGDTEFLAFKQWSEGDMFYLRGNVEIRLNNAVLKAEEVDYNEATGEMEARGQVNYRSLSGTEDLYAEKFLYNSRTEAGTYFDVHGTVSSASQGGVRVLTTDNPFYIEGKVVYKAGEHYSVHDGYVTNCRVDSPWWSMRAPRTNIVPGKSATVHRGVFRLRKVPIFYFPVFRKSLERLPRQSGFLTPNLGTSSRYGFVLGQAYYWAISRSYDATLGGTWYTDRGLASQLGFRGRPTANSYFDALFVGVQDRGRKLPDGSRRKQGGNSFNMRGAAVLPGGFRGVALINHLSSLEFRQAFTQSYDEAVFSQVRSIGFISRSFREYSFNTSLLRDENFQSLAPDDTVVLRKLPNIEFNSRDRQILDGRLPLWLSFDTSFDLVSRSQPTLKTRTFVQRGDFYPRVASKFYWKGFHLTPAFAVRQTSYGQSREDGRLVGTNEHRFTKEASLELVPPALQKVYGGPKWLGDRVKHVIEPRIRYRYVDGVQDFSQIIRFDDRDIISDTNEAEISLTNRLYAKDNGSGTVREVVSVEVWQRRFFDPDFGGAVVPGQRNVFRSSIESTPFAFIDRARSYSPVSTSIRLRPSWRHVLEWRYDYDTLRGKLSNSAVRAATQFGWGSVSVGHNAIRSPDVLTPPSNQLRTSVRFGNFNRRGWNAAVANIYDYRQKIFLYTISQITYNTDCCGFGFEWRRFAIGRTREESQFRFALSIANVGSFGTLTTRERLF